MVTLFKIKYTIGNLRSEMLGTLNKVFRVVIKTKEFKLIMKKFFFKDQPRFLAK